MNRINWWLIIVVGLFFAVILVAVWYVLFVSDLPGKKSVSVKDFDTCVQEGGVVDNSNPLHCSFGEMIFTQKNKNSVIQPAEFGENDLTFVVGPGYKKCMGVVEQLCLEVDGKLFYDEIKGFDFLPGYAYKIIVHREEAESPGPDSSAYTYTLKKVLSQTKIAGDFTPPKLAIKTKDSPSTDEAKDKVSEILDITVGESLVDCDRVDSLDCMVVDGKVAKYDIRGFVFNPGFIQEIRVEKTDRFPNKNVQVLDVDRYAYQLVKTLGKYSVNEYEQKKLTDSESLASSTATTTEAITRASSSTSTEITLSRELDGCAIAGCGSQLCVSAADAQDMVTTCQYLDYYACYATAVCAKQSNGKCGWTINSSLLQCIDSKR